MANNEVMVFSEKPSLLWELIAGGKNLAGSLGGSVSALLIGDQEAGKEAIQRGADRVYVLSGGELAEDYADTIIKLVNEYKPACLMIGATKRGNVIAGRVAAKTGTSAFVEPKKLTVDNGRITATRIVYGGKALRTERSAGALSIVIIGQGIYEAAPIDAARSGVVEAAAFVKPAWQAKLVEKKAKPPVSVNLPAAERVVCVGQGLGKKEDLGMIEELAKLVGAEVGCTRPVAEGLGWLPTETYIGVSGVSLKAKLYIGIGTSGQVYHTTGITDCRVTVAINKDKSAPIFKEVDYGIVGDLYQYVPALIDALKTRKGG